MSRTTRETRLSRVIDSAATPIRLLVATIVTALIVSVGFTSGGGTLAYWTSEADVGVTAGTASLSMTTQNFDTNAFTFRNDDIDTRGSVTITNTTQTSSATPAALTVALGRAGGAASFASALTVRVWEVPLTTQCAAVSPSGTVHTGTWESFPTITVPARLAAGQQVKYCIDTAADERSRLATTGGSQTLQPRITATLTVGNFTASTTATTTQQTSHIYPAATQVASSSYFNIINEGNGLCADVRGGNGGANTDVIGFGCKNADQNQDWRLVSSSANPSYYTIETRYNSSLVLAPKNGATTTAVQGRVAGSQAQEWQMQVRSGSGANTVYQIVQRSTGLCLTGGASEVASTLQECNGSTAQGFTLKQRMAVAPTLTGVTPACAPSGDGVSLSWGHTAAATYTIRATRTGSQPRETTASTGATSAVLTAGSAWANGVWNVSITDGTHTSQTVQVEKSSETRWSIWPPYRYTVHILECVTEDQSAGRPGVTEPPVDDEAESEETIPAPAEPEVPEDPEAPVATAPIKTATVSGDNGYFLALLWSAQTVGRTTAYTVLLDGQPLAVTPKNEYANDRLELYPTDFVGVSVGDGKLLQVFDGDTLVIAQTLRVTENPDQAHINRKVFAQ